MIIVTVLSAHHCIGRLLYNSSKKELFFMKKSISVLLSLIMVLSASGLAPVAIPAATGVITAQAATKAKINATKKTLVKGQTYTLRAS